MRTGDAGFGVCEEIGRWRDQDLGAQPRFALVTKPNCRDRCEVRSRTFAAHRDPQGVAALVGNMISDPVQRRNSVVGRRRKRMLGSKAVVRGDDECTQIAGQEHKARRRSPGCRR